MQAAFYHIFRKHLWLLLILFGLLAASKALAVRLLPEIKLDRRQLSVWLEDLSSQTDEEQKAYLAQLGSFVYAEENENDEVLHRTFSALTRTRMNREEVLRLIRFAQNGEGALPPTLPSNYQKLADFYKTLSEPALIDETALDRYWQLQDLNLAPLLSALLLTLFFGRYYEAEMPRYAATTPGGRTFRRSFRLFLLGLCLLLFLFNELFDWLYLAPQGLNDLMGVPLQSYASFHLVQLPLTVGQGLLLLFCSKLLGLLLLFQLTELFAWHKRTVKDTLVLTTLLFLLSLLVRRFASPVYFQFGLVDWQFLLSSARRLPALGISDLTLGLLLLLAANTLLFGISARLLSRW